MDARSSSRLLDGDALARLEDDGYRHELVEGMLVSEPLPADRHDRIRRRIERLLEASLSFADA